MVIGTYECTNFENEKCLCMQDEVCINLQADLIVKEVGLMLHKRSKVWQQAYLMELEKQLQVNYFKRL